MTSRPILLFAALLLISSLAGAAVPATSAGETPELMAPAVSPGCDPAELPQLNPAPMFKAATCGSCSQPICQGAGLNSICAIQGGRIYKCMNVLGNLCATSPLTHDCSCWYGPLP